MWQMKVKLSPLELFETGFIYPKNCIASGLYHTHCWVKCTELEIYLKHLQLGSFGCLTGGIPSSGGK
jgi:hypothetical protein